MRNTLPPGGGGMPMVRSPRSCAPSTAAGVVSVTQSNEDFIPASGRAVIRGEAPSNSTTALPSASLHVTTRRTSLPMDIFSQCISVRAPPLHLETCQRYSQDGERACGLVAPSPTIAKTSRGRPSKMHAIFANLGRCLLVAAAIVLAGSASARANDDAKPIRIGFSMSLTGGVAVNGKQLLLALEIWRDDVNAAGGLLGRPVEFVYYDDQSNPATVPGIYTKLIDVDKVDLTIGPYATNMVAPAILTLMEHRRLTIAFFGVAANSEFHYSNTSR